MNNTFKKGDKVFHIHYGWGEITDVSTHGTITIDFTGYLFQTMSDSNNFKLLSFTEYTLQGFTQERPVDLPEIGEYAYFWRLGSDYFCYGIYVGESNNSIYRYKMKCGGSEKGFTHISKTPPTL